MSAADFLKIIQATQDYANLDVQTAVGILNNNGDQYHRYLLTAELNAAWNGNDNKAKPGGTLASGIYTASGSSLNGQTINQINHTAFLTTPQNAGSDLVTYLSYLGGGGENAATGTCSCR